MKLILVHQILIGAALGLAVLFGVRAVVLFAREGASIDLLLAAASTGVAVALAFYYRKVRARRLAGRESMTLP